MLKKMLIAGLLVMTLIVSMIPGALAAKGVSLPDGYYDSPKTMYVYTENGGTLNVRSEPRVADGNVLGQLQYGQKVTAIGYVVVNPDWIVINYSKGPDGVGYVMKRFLQNTKPESKEQKENEEKLANLAELNRQMASYKALDTSLNLEIRQSRTSGWINFRVGPGIASDRITSLPDGHPMIAVGETLSWYQAIDTATGKIGYVSKNYVTVIGPVEPAEPDTDTKAETNEKESLGKLTVNGDFALQCKLPENYKLQVVNVKNTKVVASVLPEDNTKPAMYLTIAFNELYSDVDRLNNLTDEDLKSIEKSFTDEGEATITYRETAYGTKLMVVRETGSDSDYVDFFTIYKGYQIEFVMVPGEGTQELTDEQIKMCVDFLTEMDFVAA